MKNYYILGKSSCTIAILLENLHSLYDKEFSVTIIKNMEDQSHLPYSIDGISIKEIDIDDLDVSELNNCILGVMTVNSKKTVHNIFNDKYPIANYINVIPQHSTVSQTVKLGTGCMLNYGSVLAPYVQIGNFVTVNRNSSIGHHTTIGDFVTINPGVNVAGNCNISEGVTLGIGCNVIDGITIGKNCVIGAGSLVTKDIPEGMVAYGVPTKIVRPI